MSDIFDVYDFLSPPSALDPDPFAPPASSDPFTTFDPSSLFDPLTPLDPVPPPELVTPNLFTLDPVPPPEFVLPDLAPLDPQPVPQVDPHVPGSLLDSAGDASVSDDHWYSQGNEQACAVVSQGSIIEQITGHPFDLAGSTQWLEQQGWYDPTTGTMPQDCGRLLDAYGIAHQDGPATVVQLYDALQRGDQVMVALDANEIWSPKDDATGRPLEQPGSAGHAVWVTEIGRDAVDGEWKVVVNDSAHPGGRANTIDLADFLEATDDFGGFSVVADSSSYDGRPGPFATAGVRA